MHRVFCCSLRALCRPSLQLHVHPSLSALQHVSAHNNNTYPLRTLTTVTQHKHTVSLYQSTLLYSSVPNNHRLFGTSLSRRDEKANKMDDRDDEHPPNGLVAKFKWYSRKYWYVVVPVHVVTSVVWFGSFYYLAYSGLDIIALMNTLHLPASAIAVMSKIPPSAGHAAVAYTLYKIVSPVRYGLTIGGTIVSIRTLRMMGVLPTAQEVRSDVKEYVEDKREDWKRVQERVRAKHGWRAWSRRMHRLRHPSDNHKRKD